MPRRLHFAGRRGDARSNRDAVLNTLGIITPAHAYRHLNQFQSVVIA
jgi:hypothetical protein